MTSARRVLIVDTDAGFDDLVAIQCLLRNRRRHDQDVLLTTVGGVIFAARGAATLKRIFPQQQAIVAGRNAPVMPYDPIPEWLDSYRSSKLDAFVQEWNGPAADDTDFGTKEDAENDKEHDSKDAALRAVMDRIDKFDENSVDILCIGPLTNLANWLDHDNNRCFTSKIHQVYILGGNHPNVAHTIQSPEFNFGLDPHAAKQVLESPLLANKIRLMTSSVCNMETIQSAMGEQSVKDFIVDMAQRNNKCFLRTVLRFDSWAYSISCDPVCAFCIDNPDAVTWEPHQYVRVQILDQQPSVLLVKAEGEDIEDDNDNDCRGIQIAVSVDFKKYLEWVRENVNN
ncbi:Inosine-uridine preferring nucleoside hydrolase [Seminavis robusta]|uniref:Inosine-uridine preferring nucleoside hydrolase n=1 Tax=Seminavis robusta TaxID=568900 RepID=A0A9N8HQG4_9STRA|nr:Inosine-uridine preferring nucleoside hydrolase [Seminavis robusta]|eukprot:Sro1440_g272880.1 Inosine-uridine preferring nucleoside hydrolase (341) ;mRNA; f:14796-15818